MRYLEGFTFLVILCLVLPSCSGNSESPVLSSVISGDQSHSANNYLWGIWEILIDPQSKSVEAIPLRQATFTSNLEHFVPNSLIKFGNFEINGDIIEIDIGLEHTFPALKRFTGFDVLGVFMGDGNDTYPGDPTLSIPSENDQRLLNSDGYTRWFNPNEFKGVDEIPPLFGYNPGKYGTPGYKPTSDLNGYKYYCNGLQADYPFNPPNPPDDEDEFQYLVDNADGRGMLTEGSVAWRHYSLIFPGLTGSGILNFHYAVIGHWEPNINEPGPPDKTPDDFPLEANVQEAVVCDISDSSLIWNDDGDFGGKVILDISPWDWSAKYVDVMDEYSILCYSEAWTGAYEVDMANPSGGGDNYSTYHVEIAVENQWDCNNELPVWIECKYPGYDYTNPFGFNNDADGPLSSYFLVNIDVQCEKPEWIHVISPNGGEEFYLGCPIDIEWDSINVPGTVRIEYSTDDFFSDVNIIEANVPNTGNYIWDDHPFEFSDTFKIRVSSTDKPSINDVSDGYYSVIREGWVVDWGGSGGFYNQYHEGTSNRSMAMDSEDNIYITGAFLGYADFDPGDGVDLHIANGVGDAFLCKYDSDGNYIWGRSWGGVSTSEQFGMDYCFGVAIDDSGNVYSTGGYHDTCDFDPGPGTAWRTSLYWTDIYLLKFDPDGNFVWVHTWGSLPYPSAADHGLDVALDGSGDVYFVGLFRGTMDFDPGPGEEWHTKGSGGPFLMKFLPDGTYLWSKVWGGTGWSPAGDILIDDDYGVFVSGGFRGIGDFDPDNPGLETSPSNGWSDACISKFDLDGNWQWTRVWGGLGQDGISQAGIDASGNLYIGGTYWGTVDFDPGPGVWEETAEYNPDYLISDAFVSKFNSSGEFIWVNVWGTSALEKSEVVVDKNFNRIYSVGCGGFVERLAPDGESLWRVIFGDGVSVETLNAGVASDGNIYVYGMYSGATDFNPHPIAEDIRTPIGPQGAFIEKLQPCGQW